MVEPGRRCLGDRYELHQLIASGGMGQVWRSTDQALHRSVAVKVLRSEYTGDPTFVARFRAEAQHAASLSHPNIAAVFDYGEEVAQDGTGETLAYLVMELVEGEPLSALVAREGPLDPATTLSLLRQTAFGLGEAHKAGMVHRDVKPGNILVRPDGSVKITDFGIAWSARSVALTKTGQVIGTPQYLSPEQAEGRPASPASDVYALGLIGYECLTGHPAFDGDNAVTIALKQVRQEPEPLPDEVAPEVRELIGRSLTKDPSARFADGTAFVAAIDAILAGRPLPETTATRALEPAAAVPPPRTGETETVLTGSVARPAAARRRGKVAMVLLPLLALLAGAGIAVALLQALASDPGGSTVEAAEQGDSGSIVLDAERYIGRPVDEVVDQLTSLGLNVEPEAEVRDDVAPGQVVGVEPHDEPLAGGATVVVTYATSGVEGGATDRPAVTGAAEDGSAEPTTEGERAAVPADEEPATVPPPTPTAPATSAPPAPSTEAEPVETTPTTSESAGTSTSTATATTSSATADSSRSGNGDSGRR